MGYSHWLNCLSVIKSQFQRFTIEFNETGLMRKLLWDEKEMNSLSPDAQALSDAVARVRETMGNAALTSQLRAHLTAAQSEGLSSQYPRSLYHENGDTKIVLSAHEEDEAAGDGFGRDPHPVHRGISAPQIEDMPEQAERAGPRRGRPPKAAMQPDASAVAEHPDTASAPDLTNVKE